MTSREEWTALLIVALLTATVTFVYLWTTDQQRGKVPVNCVQVVEYQDCEWVTPEKAGYR